MGTITGTTPRRGSIRLPRPFLWDTAIPGVALLMAVPVLVIAAFVFQPVNDNWHHLAENLLAEYHRQFPLRAGMPREEVKSRLAPYVSQLTSRLFNEIVERARRIDGAGHGGVKYRARAGADGGSSAVPIGIRLVDKPLTIKDPQFVDPPCGR